MFTGHAKLSMPVQQATAYWVVGVAKVASGQGAGEQSHPVYPTHHISLA